MFTNPTCRLGGFEFFFRYTDIFKVENSYIIKEFVIICVLDIERVKLIKKRFSELIHILWKYMLHSFTASDQMTLQVFSLSEVCIASWTAEELEQCMDVVYVTNVTIIWYQLNVLLVIFDAWSCKFPNHCAVKKSMSCMKILILTISSTDGFRSMQAPWSFEGSGFVLLKSKRLNNFDVSSPSLAFSCKWRASAPMRQILSLYGFLVFCS